MAPLNELAGLLPAINEVQPDRSYLDVMFSYAGWAGTSAVQCTTEAGGSLQREAFSATSHVPYNLLNDGAAQLVDRCVLGHRLLGARETSVSLDALGGAVKDLPVDATGFGLRDAYATVQYTVTFAGEADPSIYDAFVRGSRAAMKQYWGTGAYFNYIDASLRAGPAYFGGNAPRLARVRAEVDPAGCFALPGFMPE